MYRVDGVSFALFLAELRKTVQRLSDAVDTNATGYAERNLDLAFRNQLQLRGALHVLKRENSFSLQQRGLTVK